MFNPSLMHTRIFALIIGIDHYQSGSIWNLNSCVADAKRIRRFLIDVLNVPRDQIRLLLDRQAHKQAIEDSFMAHLINNTAIDRGDAILVYFAGHGSSILAPRGWFQGGRLQATRKVEVLCPWDHDKKQNGGRVAGISDRSMHAFFSELARVKGDNITFITDCCFSPSKKSLDRSTIRYTPTTKAKPDDLYASLWSEARGQLSPTHGFYTPQCESHVFLASCRPGDLAVEGKDGGRFTSSFLEAAAEVSLHRTSYATLFDRIQQKIESSEQRPICLGKRKSCIVFDAIPFIADPQFILVNFRDGSQPRVEVGAVQGIVNGSEFSLHIHNYRASRNPTLGALIVTEVHPTWCLGRLKSPIVSPPKTCWAYVTRWNNRQPFRVYLKTTLVSLCKGWKLRRSLSTESGGPATKGGLNVIRVKSPNHADISLAIGRRSLIVERSDDGAVKHARHVSKIVNRSPADVIDDAARFNLHLYRRNPDAPLNGQVRMELFRLNSTSWARYGENLLIDGKANIMDEKGAIFTIVISNKSNFDLWPYLFYMDPISFAITKLYDPELSYDKTPPLPRRSQFIIGTGQPGSEALSFSPGDDPIHDSGYLKLFLTSKPVPFSIIEQGNMSESLPLSENGAGSLYDISGQIWDSISGSLRFTRGSQ